MEEWKYRKTVRLKGADYNRNGAVFLTICVKERRCILSRIVGTGVLDGPQIEVTEYGWIADKYILKKTARWYTYKGVTYYTLRGKACEKGTETKNLCPFVM